MHGVTRFLSRREKRSSGRNNTANQENKEKVNAKPGSRTPEYRDAFFKTNLKKTDKEEETKVKELSTKLLGLGISDLNDDHIEYALRTKYADGDTEKALELLMLFEDSLEGILKEYDPEVHMLGAENRENTTCYLDALLFAMFARLDSFEGILYPRFADEPRSKLITVDMTKHLQDSLASCGWPEAAEVRQQDTSEAFTFITGVLELPMLTLKTDIYHTGKEDAQDDHKFINERLLEVAIPDISPEANDSITLEECLQEYFNNRIEVKRYLQQRRNTLQSPTLGESSREKEQSIHIETVELDSTSLDSPLPITPTSTTAPDIPRGPIDGRRRTDSIFSERIVRSKDVPKLDITKATDDASLPKGRPRGRSIRKEVMMPAWQFFSLIPWYTDNAPKSDPQVAAHFAGERPVLGICLKRYTMTANGRPRRLNTLIDIPIEIALPHFVSDDRIDDDSALFGNFKLVLQSIVCHRGISTDSGHYIALVRGDALHESNQSACDTSPPKYSTVKWMLFDDMNKSARITHVDIEETLKKESPYLLFYQVQTIDNATAADGPPSYNAADASRAASFISSENLSTVTSAESSNVATETLTLPIIAPTTSASPTSSPVVARHSVPAESALKPATTDGRDHAPRAASMDLSALTAQPIEPRGRLSLSSNRDSVVIDDASTAGSSSVRGNTAPPTPDEGRLSFLNASSRRGSKADKSTKSRPASSGGDGRLAATVSLLTGRKSRDKLSDRDESAIANGNNEIDKTTETVLTAAAKFGSIGRSKSKRKREGRHKSNSANAAKADRPDRECSVM